MKYSKKQKFISSLVIFSLLFGITIRIPLIDFFAYAGNNDFFNLVGIIVEEEIYNKIDSEVETYAENIQKNLENTKVVIIPTPKNTPAIKVASTLESLYFEGYKSLKDVNFESKLVGTVIVGNIKIPEVYIGSNSEKTIVPYTDFEDKKYIFNHKTNKYEENSNNLDGLKSEIWHGVISPNTGDEGDDINAIKDYFSKNEDYYNGTGNFKTSDGITNGKKTELLNSDYEPIVFYFDNFREKQSLNLNSYLGYKGYLDNKEDLVFNRFTKEFAEKIKKEVLGNQNKEVESLISKLDSPVDLSSVTSGLDSSKSPDIQTKYIIQNAVKKFIEMFSQGTISGFRENIQKAGRYNLKENNINADIVPQLVVAVDLVNDQILKQGVIDLENKIDTIVQNKLQEDIYVPIKIEHNQILDDRYLYLCGEINCEGHNYISYFHEYINFLYGKQLSSISNAEDCSIFRGSTNNSGNLVEANRGNNIGNIEGDISKLQSESNSCITQTQYGYFSGNTPLNMTISDGIGKLGSHNLLNSIEPIFDIKGSTKVLSSSNYPNNTVSKTGISYLDCFKNNFLISKRWTYYDNSNITRGNYTHFINYQIPINGQTRVNWTCSNDSLKINYTKNYDQLSCNGLVCTDSSNNYTIYYKKIPSYIIHKSPSFSELDAQTKGMITESLPIDKDRYIDYKGGNQYQKINYPYLFRLGVEDGQELTLDNVDKSLKKTLNGYDSKLGESLLAYIKSKSSVIISGKSSKYYDALVFSIFWNNLDVSGKYKFVLENYLSDQLGGNDFDFSLVENKKQYEIAYLGAEGDAKNMYVLLDPNDKDNNPYTDIISKNQELNNSILGSNAGQQAGQTESVFKCGPAEGVPIWEWWPAIKCRLDSLLPPTVKITSNQCGGRTLGLSNEDEKLLLENGGDTNKNGVIDCLEQKLNNGGIELGADTSKIYYNTIGKLKAIIKDEKGNNLTLDSSSKIGFELQKITVPEDENFELSPSNSKIIYNINSPEGSELNNPKIINNYINFKSGDIRANYGIGEKTFTSKNKTANITFKAFLKNESVNINKNSNNYEIQIRGDKLFLETKKIIKNGNEITLESGINHLKVSDKANIFFVNSNKVKFNENDIKNLSLVSDSNEKLFFSLSNIDKNGKKLNLSYPINIQITSEIENHTVIIENDNDSYLRLGTFNKSGNYNIIFTDKFGYKITKEFTLIPEIPSKADFSLGTNVVETGGGITTNLVTLYDKYNNIASGNLYKIDLEIDGNGILFNDNKKDKITYSTYEGYNIFRLISTNNDDNNKLKYILKDDLGKSILNGEKEIKTKEKIDIVVISQNSNIKIGGSKYTYKLSYRDERGNILNNFNSRVYFNIPGIYGKSLKDYFEVKSGEAIIEFTTTNLAGKNIQLEFQTEGLKTTKKINVDILPEKPIKMDMSFSATKLEANSTNYSKVKVELKDRYGNLVFNDSSTNLKIDVLDKYKSIISPEKGSLNITDGIGTFNISATSNPGIAYFKVSSEPSLENNSFEIPGGTKIYGAGQTAGKIETYYFWNKDKIVGKKYNSIYTTLLGANYGDITEKNYLAGSILFDKGNRALGVTSLLNNPYKTNDIINILSSGNVKNIYDSSDLSQDIETSVSFKNDKIVLNLYNASLNTFIGNIFYNFDNNTNLKICDQKDDKCKLDNNKTSIFLKGLSNNFSGEINDNQIQIKDITGNKILSIDKNGKITRNGNIEFEIDTTNNSNYLLLNIYYDGKQIGKLGFNFISPKINISRDNTAFENKIDNLKNSILILLTTSQYSGKESLDNVILYYNDPFSSKNTLNAFSSSNTYGYENFVNKGSLGWGEGNKSLLAFSSGKSIGESVKDYMSFSVINLGDPVVSLKKIKEKLPGTTQDRKFDSTIGKLLSIDSNIDSYEIFDYNKDEREDILLIKNDGTLKLLENKKVENNFIDKGNLAYIIDLGSKKLIKTGDFTGDGYEDIFFINNKGEPFLLNNHEKDFYRISLKEQFKLNGRIVFTEKFDMDNDGIDDIITLDEDGNINIFYGSSNSDNPTFTKKNIYSGFGVTLNSDIRDDNALVYFDLLPQIDKSGYNEELLKNSENYTNEFNKNLNNASTTNNTSQKGSISTEQIDALLFEELNYPKDKKAKEEIKTKNVNIDDLQKIYNLSQEEYSKDENVTFIKSNYSKNVGLKVEKKFTDKNGGFLKSNDIVGVEITLTNTSGRTLNKVAYGEKIDEVFELNKESITGGKELSINYDIPNVDFLIDDFSLNSGESIKINYILETRAIQFGNLQVGLFEKGELGDDKFGDIILKSDNQNCSKTVDIFRSISSRDYQKGIKTPDISQDKQKIPDELAKNDVDNNGNGIADYLDELSDPSNITALKNYSQNALNDLNDTDEYNDNLNINQKVDKALENVDNTLNKLTCETAGCISTPLNWAPLAPGQDPTFLGVPIGDGLYPGEGLPVFSMFTGLPTPFGCFPVFWPLSPMPFLPPLCSNALSYSPPPGPPFSITGAIPLGAGGRLGTNSPTNFLRIFVTPTLTGAMGTAICFGGPASVVGWLPTPGISPIVLGGNCIVMVKSLSKVCKNDGSDGDVASIGQPSVIGDGFSSINGNCSSTNNSQPPTVSDNIVQEYYDYLKNGILKPSLNTAIESFYKGVSKVGNIASSSYGSNSSLFSGNGLGNPDINLSLDFNALGKGNFPDVLKITKSRISSFPNFIMDWATRQIEEIATKLTDFPTIFLIIPDFSGIFDGDFSGINDLSDISQNKTISTSKRIGNTINNTIVGIGTQTVSSGIKDAYNFLAQVPLINIEKETVNINIPWIDKNTIEKAITNFKDTSIQWRDEAKTKTDSRKKSFGSTFDVCNYADRKKQLECEKYNKISIQTEALISSLEKNIEILEDYKKTPEKINKLLNFKERYLEQILCNMQTVSKITSGRIGKNGKRFKAWVETYILIKAILKSWQMFVDLFLDYDAECHQCKNERGDLMTWLWSLISAIIPKIPVIQFPKMPDVIIDLHNIRVGLNVVLPEFSISDRPILIPELPKLILPEIPTININLPKLPILPTLEIPELPDLPSLPTIELPDLPPPPKLPKLLSSIEGVLNILKLITKIMCILRSSPFVPEWRAGDQIAFLTERFGYLGLDFLFGINYPQFSYPFVDAIKVTSYVNLEVENDYITELATQAAFSINNFSSNLIPQLNIEFDDIDFSSRIPNSVDINIGNDGTVEGETGFNNIKNPVLLFAKVIARDIEKLTDYIDDNKNITVDNEEFKKIINKQLASKEVVSNPKMDEIRKIWDDVNKMTYSSEEKFIKDLKDQNNKKYSKLRDIINTEIIKNKKLKENYKNIIDNKVIKVSSNDTSINTEFYNKQFEEHNNNFKKSALELYKNSNNKDDNLIKEKEIILNKLKGGLETSCNFSSNKNNLLADTSTTGNSTSSTSQSDSNYSYVYKGLYIIESGISYKLFNYLDELTGDEEEKIIDFDKDGDEDLLYIVNGELYLKENLKDKSDKTYVSEPPIVLKSNDNKFYKENIFYEAINNFKISGADNGAINAVFSESTRNEKLNYRIEFFNLVDKALYSRDTNYYPRGIKRTIVDAFTSLSNDKYIITNDNNYTVRKNLGQITSVGDLKGVKLNTYKFKNIKDDLINNKVISLMLGTKLYSGNSSVNITYLEDGSEEEKTLKIRKSSNVEFNKQIKIIEVSGDIYVKGTETQIINGTDIKEYISLPLLPGTKIEVDNSQINNTSVIPYIEIEYYDGSQLDLDFREVSNYEIIDLGEQMDNILIRLDKQNDYYYATIKPFSENILGIDSNQIVFSPQTESDTIAPEVAIKTGIKIPVYQNKIFDLTPYIYEDSGVKNIEKVFIDFDLEKDSDNDGNKKNDNDTEKIKIIKSDLKIEIGFGIFEELMKKKIGITITDKNGNNGYYEANFEVYAPIPEIKNYNNGVVNGNINEELHGEPITLYKYRSGVITKLESIVGKTKAFTVSGGYNFEINKGGDGLKLVKDNSLIASIKEKTGVITLNDNGTNISVLSSNNSNNNIVYPKIILLKNNEEIFYQYLKFDGKNSINLVDDFQDINTKGIYLQFIDKSKYNFFKIPDGAKYNPGTISIYRSLDETKEPLFTIFNDGRINTINENYTLEYFDYNGNAGYKLIDKHFNIEIAKLLLKIDGEYVIK